MNASASSSQDIAAQLRDAVIHQRAGRSADAERLYREVLKVRPLQPDANHNLAVTLAQRGELAAAAPHLKVALEQRPGESRYWTSYFDCLIALGEMQKAQDVLRQGKAFGLAPQSVHQMQARLGVNENPESLYRTAIKMHQEGGQGPQAEALYRKVIALAPQAAEAYCNLGSLLRDRGALDEAAVQLRRALKLRSEFPAAHYNLGNVLKDAGDVEGAVAAYRIAIAQKPGFVQAFNNLGNALKLLRRIDEAEAAYGQAIALAPDFAEAHFNIGNVLEERGALDAAEASYRRALQLVPDYAQVYNHLGAVLSEKGHTVEAFEAFTHHARLTYGPNVKNVPRAAMTPHKLRHDREQRDYLGHPLDDDALSDRLHIEGGERLAGPAVNPQNDVAAITRQWNEDKPQLVVIDELLSAAALESLRRFCWGSTFWRNSFDAGYLGAVPESGFACPLLAQIGEELRAIYPAIFSDHPLLHAWAFKYESGMAGTGVHADFAAVNVNFWITPDAANLDPASGGLVVYDTAAPLDWDFAKYNLDQNAIRDFLRQSQSRPVTVPYRANRAVIFDSDLFHETDKIAFKEGYLNRRINVTLLYGWRAGKGGKRV